MSHKYYIYQFISNINVVSNVDGSDFEETSVTDLEIYQTPLIGKCDRQMRNLVSMKIFPYFCMHSLCKKENDIHLFNPSALF